MSSLKKLKEAVLAAKMNLPKKTAKPSMLSTEYVEDTDAEDDSTESDSSVETAPKSTSTEAKEPLRQPRKVPNGSARTKPSSTTPKASSVASSDSQSDSGSGSESAATSGSENSSSSNDSSKGKERSPNPIRTSSTTGIGTKRKLTPELQPAKSQPAYIPPSGFETIRSSSASPTVASTMFSRSSLTGKQIWHITAPSSVPVDLIKQVSLESVAKGEAALNYKDTDYGFAVNGEGSQTSKKLLVAGADSSYQLAAIEIAQTLQLQQLVKLPSLQLTQSQPSRSSQGSSMASALASKPIRQQPEGLRMRFGPLGDHVGTSSMIGFDTSSDESSIDQAGAGPEFRTSRGLAVHGGPVKRKHAEVNGSNANGVSSSQLTRDGQEAKRKKAKYGAGRHTQSLPPSSILEPSMDLDPASDAHVGCPVQAQSQETPRKRKELDQERRDRKAKEKQKSKKGKDHRAKDSHRDLKNGDKFPTQKRWKSIAT